MNKIFLLLVFLPMIIYSQSKTITGSVTDDGGLPLPGVTILVKNSKNLGVATDFDGNFSITIPSTSSKILVFSYLGYTTQEVNVSNTSNVNLIMIPDQTQLDEVVVVGYGTVLKKDVTGALTSVKVKDNVANQSGTIDQLLQGRAAGVQVTQNAGAPGSGISVKIRGTNSLRGNNEPLYVIDGVIISSAGEDVIAAGGVGNSGQETQNGLNGINPRDIESIQVLKDASATAIYGSRGANGVVLITTKKGVKGKVKIKSFITTSIRTIDKKYDVLDGIGYANYQNEMALLNGLNPRFQIDGSQIFGITYDTAGNPNVSNRPAQILNWQDELYRQGFSTKVGFSASGGSDNGNYYVSLGFDEQEGIVSNSGLKSSDIRINLNQDLTNKLKLQARFSASFNDINFTEGGDLTGANQSFVRNAILFRPVITEEIEDFGEDLEASNPYSWVNDFEDVSKAKRYIASIGLTYKLPVKGLRYQLKAGGNVRTKDRRRFLWVNNISRC